MEWAKGIKEIVWIDDLGDTPAKVNRRTGVMYASRKHLSAMPKEFVVFIFLHEKAHVELQTTNEYQADAQAFKEYADYDFTKAERNYWAERARNENFEHQGGLIPKLYIGGKAFCINF